MDKHLVLALLISLGGVAGCSDDGGGAGSQANASGGAGNTSASPGDGDSSAPGDGDGTGDAAGTVAGDGDATGAGDGDATNSGGEGDACVNAGEINFDCPFSLPPIDGSCAPHGECCHRASNSAALDSLGPDEPAQLEYRLNFVEVINQPMSVGNPALAPGTQARADICSGEQCLLWRFTAPRAGGEFVAGAGEVEIGVGAYNCDGTYSFYGPKAAPERSEVGETDPARWQSIAVPAEVDPTKDGMDRYHIPFATDSNREITRSIFVWPMDLSVDWELASSGFKILDLDTSDAGLDCMGTRDGFNWAPSGKFVSYSPIEGNDTDISNLTNQTYCALLAFGLLPEGMKELRCKEVPRCMPGTADCAWIKLPDSLCPEDDAERALFGCHLGAEGNPNEEDGYPDTLGCTQEAPTAALDPDTGATSEGQCCDPLGESSTLPPCNAYRTVQAFVAAAADITDDPRNGLPPSCQ